MLLCCLKASNGISFTRSVPNLSNVLQDHTWLDPSLSFHTHSVSPASHSFTVLQPQWPSLPQAHQAHFHLRLYSCYFPIFLVWLRLCSSHMPHPYHSALSSRVFERLSLPYSFSSPLSCYFLSYYSPLFEIPLFFIFCFLVCLSPIECIDHCWILSIYTTMPYRQLVLKSCLLTRLK